MRANGDADAVAPPPAAAPPRSVTPEFPCGLVLACLYLMGAEALDVAQPDLDLSFGVDAYRAHGLVAVALAAAALFTVLLARPVAEWLERAASAVGGRIPARARLPALLLACGVLFATLTDTSLSGDGMGIVYQVLGGHVSSSSPLTSLLHVGAMRALPLDPRDVMRLSSCAAGVAYAALAVWAGRVCFERAADRVAATVLLLTAGSATLFFGSVEIYALPVAGTLLFLVLALRRVEGTDRRPWPALALGVVATLHGSTLVLVPALAYAVWCAPDARRDVRGLLPWVAGLLLPVVAVGLVLWIGVWDGRSPLADGVATGNVLGAQGQGPFLPLLPTPSNVSHRYAILDVEHLAGVLNVMLLACPAGLLLALAGRRRGPRVALVTLAAAGFVTLALVWNVTYALRRDWDLFATLGVPLALLGALRFLGGDAVPGRAARVTALCLFAFVPQVLGHVGDRVQRRDYAAEVADAYGRVQPPDRVAPYVGRWRDEALRLDPHGVRAAADAAWKALRRGDLAAAEERAGVALLAEPDNTVALYALAETRLEEGRPDEARLMFREILRTAREDLRPRARRFLARLALDEGAADVAAAHLERGLREEVAWQDEAVLSLRLLAEIRRGEGRVSLAEELERQADRRESTGLK